MSAPCESCPPDCSTCAWERQGARSLTADVIVVREEKSYGCIFGGEIVVEKSTGIPALRRGDIVHPLSPVHGNILRGTRLEKDVMVAYAA